MPASILKRKQAFNETESLHVFGSGLKSTPFGCPKLISERHVLLRGGLVTHDEYFCGDWGLVRCHFGSKIGI